MNYDRPQGQYFKGSLLEMLLHKGYVGGLNMLLRSTKCSGQRYSANGLMTQVLKHSCLLTPCRLQVEAEMQTRLCFTLYSSVRNLPAHSTSPGLFMSMANEDVSALGSDWLATGSLIDLHFSICLQTHMLLREEQSSATDIISFYFLKETQRNWLLLGNHVRWFWSTSMS